MKYRLTQLYTKTKVFGAQNVIFAKNKDRQIKIDFNLAMF